MTTSLQNKKAIVSGASRGIGRAIAEALSSAGATVSGTATTDKGAKAIASFLGKDCGYVLDVSNTDSVAQFAANYKQQHGTADILVNNAGITRDNLLMRMSEDEWQQVINTNLNSAFRMSKIFMRDMIKARHGRIINISSVVASTGNGGQANYAASKSGLEGLGRAMALELGSRQITVNTVAPGFIETDMTNELASSVRDSLKERIPLKRFGKTTEVAALVVFLASDQAAYITGATIHVNGGMYLS